MIAAIALAGPAIAQQSVPAPGTVTLQVIDPAQVPVSSYVVGTDSAGRDVVETRDSSTMQDVGWHWTYKFNNLFAGTNFKPANQQFNVTNQGTTQLSATPLLTNPEVPGVDALTAGLNALNDGSGGGCAISFCISAVAIGSYVTQCQPSLDLLASRLRAGEPAPTCKDSEVAYVPYSCTSPWTLVDLGGWQNYACQAVVDSGNPYNDGYQAAVNQANIWNQAYGTTDAMGNLSYVTPPPSQVTKVNGSGSQTIWMVTGGNGQGTITYNPNGTALASSLQQIDCTVNFWACGNGDNPGDGSGGN
jgi:hypothetical protein